MELLTADIFRKKIAGLADPSKNLPPVEEEVIKLEAINFIAMLPLLFSDDFDRKTLWERIGNGIVASSQKCGGDYELFINMVLDFIKADPGKTAACKELFLFLESMKTKPKEWREVFLNLIEKKYNIYLVYGRELWNRCKGGEL